MAERKATNRYYPPDFDPRKHKSLDHYHGQHPLRERAKKIGQGILVIRFEMPYNIWCGGCESHIGMGVRYNAEKSKVGKYYTTPIYKFRMKCHLCDNYFEIQTDPQNHDYVILSGARRKEQRWDPKENEQVVPEERDTIKKLATDAMFKLEHGVNDKSKIKNRIPGLNELAELQSVKKDDYMINKLARKKFRDEKKSLKKSADKDAALLLKSSLNISLVKESEEDVRLAGLLKYHTVQSFDEKQTEKREEIKSRPIFQASTSSTESKSAITDIRKKLGVLHAKKTGDPFCGPSVSKTETTILKNSAVIVKRDLQRTDSSSSSLGSPIEQITQEEKVHTDNVKEHVVSSCSSSGDVAHTETPLNNSLNTLISNYCGSSSEIDSD